jgi:hypothetical protein
MNNNVPKQIKERRELDHISRIRAYSEAGGRLHKM